MGKASRRRGGAGSVKRPASGSVETLIAEAEELLANEQFDRGLALLRQAHARAPTHIQACVRTSPLASPRTDCMTCPLSPGGRAAGAVACGVRPRGSRRRAANRGAPVARRWAREVLCARPRGAGGGGADVPAPGGAAARSSRCVRRFSTFFVSVSHARLSCVFARGAATTIR